MFTQSFSFNSFGKYDIKMTERSTQTHYNLRPIHTKEIDKLLSQTFVHWLFLNEQTMLLFNTCHCASAVCTLSLDKQNFLSFHHNLRKCALFNVAIKKIRYLPMFWVFILISHHHILQIIQFLQPIIFFFSQELFPPYYLNSHVWTLFHSIF